MQIASDLEEDNRQSAQMAQQTKLLKDIQRAAYPLNDLTGLIVFKFTINKSLRKKLPRVIRSPGLLSSFGDPYKEGSIASELAKLSFSLNVGKSIDNSPGSRELAIYGRRFLSNIDKLATAQTPFFASYLKSENDGPDELSFSMLLTLENNSGRFLALNELGGQPLEFEVTYGGPIAMAACKVDKLYLSSERTGLSYGFDFSGANWSTTSNTFIVRSKTMTVFPGLDKWVVPVAEGN